MFSNLSKGSVLYGYETKGEMKLFTAPIESVSFPRTKSINTTFGQLPETVVDIVAVVNGERREFKQVPSNSAIADFGPDTLVLADSRDSLNGYVNSMLQNSRNIISSIEKHKHLITQYEGVLRALNPGHVDQGAVKELSSKVNRLEDQLSEMLSLLKGENQVKPTNV